MRNELQTEEHVLMQIFHGPKGNNYGYICMKVKIGKLYETIIGYSYG
jgi:hypothetical protein